MKVLISAYACEPGKGSEPGAGWAWCRGAAVAGHDVWVVTRTNNRGPIEKALGREPGLSVRPVYVDLPPRLRELKRAGLNLHTYYVLWQLAARRTMVALARDVEFDVSHHVTFAADWMPAAALGIPHVPSVWGPVGGSGAAPPSVLRWLGWRGVLGEVARAVPVRVVRWMVASRLSRTADLVVAQNDDAASYLARHSRGGVVTEPNVALSLRGLSTTSRPDEARGRRARRAVFVGRLLPWKGLALVLASMRHLGPEWTLEVFGDGPDRQRCERLASSAGLSERVAFHGAKERPTAVAALREADVHVLPSVHDSAGWVIGEAAAVGTPTVCLQIGGPATMTARAGGIAVTPGPNLPRRFAHAMSSAIALTPASEQFDESRLPGLVTAWYDYVARSL